MNKAEHIQAILDGWRDEYGVVQPIWFKGWENMNRSGTIILGLCSYYKNLCEIRLGDKFEDRPLGWLETSILWHEFCHANAYLEDGEDDAHNDHFAEYRKRKMTYFWGNLVAKFVYIFL